ncbi:hypothetical protein CBR_g81562 [Chara braunii]|uniref:non-specific serine/threonine protein kinase n=1 Tax=Chara braunii TaxID=69332 RepID=A0A388KAS7_CHABU|nr:hypothetical protein CBR_g81562 [Chara braunii]|eukprot:GBG67137.1 hypothetical protein CBR_g81562 [Chara braunii]
MPARSATHVVDDRGKKKVESEEDDDDDDDEGYDYEWQILSSLDYNAADDVNSFPKYEQISDNAARFKHQVRAQSPNYGARRHDTIIVPLVDGMVHALDVQSGKLKWSFSSGPPLVSNMHTWPTVLATHDEKQAEESDDADTGDDDLSSGDDFERLYFPGTDGSLYSYGRGKGDKFERLGINIKKLVEASPSMTSRGLVAIGEKRSTVFMLDSVTGDVIQEFRSTDNGDSNTGKILLPEGLEACLVTEDNLDQIEEGDLDGENAEGVSADKLVCKRRPLFLSRTDWNVTWRSVTTQKIMHNLGFGEVKTLEYPFWKESTEEGLPAGGNELRSRQALRLFSDTNSNDLQLWDLASGTEQWRVTLDARPIVAFSLSGELISKLEPVGRTYQVRETYIGRVGNQVYFLPLPLVQRAGTDVIPLSSTAVALRHTSSETMGPLQRIGSKHLVPVEIEEEWDPCFPRENETEDRNLPAVREVQNTSRPAPMPSLVNMMLMWYVYLTPLSVIVAIIIGSAIAACMIFGSLTGMNEKGREQSAKEHRKRPPRRRQASVPKEEPQPPGQGDGLTQVQKQQLKAAETIGARKSRPDDLPEGNDGRYVNRLYVTSKIIGYGSHGTIVVEGVLDKRPVAIKRLLLQFYEKARKEIGALIVSDEHPNVVRLYAMEEDSAFVYVALERCNFSLSDLVIGSSGYESTTGSTNCSVDVPGGPVNTTAVVVKDPHGVFRHVTKPSREGKEIVVQLWDERTWPTPVLVQLMKDIVAGLAHLHSVGIVHRDLKPQNVLVCTMSNRQLRAKLSDMGISKRLEAEQISFSQGHWTGVGSAGWQAPEQLQHGRQTRSVDMFSLGCVLFFCVSGGCHPFGDKFERDRNIINGQSDLFPISHVPEAFDLIGALLDPDPTKRPTAACALMHPLLWSPEERLNFLKDASDRVEGEDREENSQLLMKLEDIGPFALGGPWDEKLSPELLDNLGKYRRYNVRSVRDLLRVIRNKLHHYRELPSELQ